MGSGIHKFGDLNRRRYRLVLPSDSMNGESSAPEVFTPLPSGTGSRYSAEWSLGGYISEEGLTLTALSGIDNKRSLGDEDDVVNVESLQPLATNKAATIKMYIGFLNRIRVFSTHLHGLLNNLFNSTLD